MNEDIICQISSVIGVNEYVLSEQNRVEISGGKVTKLDLCGLNLQNIPISLTEQFPHIESLYLHNNQIEELDPKLLAPLKKLLNLNLAGNSITHLPPSLLTRNTQLLFLDLSNNEIKALPSSLFRNKPYLYYLNIENNPLSALPEIIHQLNLETLKSDFKVQTKPKSHEKVIKRKHKAVYTDQSGKPYQIPMPTRMVYAYVGVIVISLVAFLINQVLGIIMILLSPLILWYIVDENFKKQHNSIVELIQMIPQAK